jgi:hypothetical protein
VLLVLVLAGCAAGPNPEVGAAGDDSVVAGFWLGLWHGLILPVTFIISLFTDGVTIYEVHNSGNWYDFGYALGLGASVGGGPFGASRRRR